MRTLFTLQRITLTLGLIALPCFANESVQRARQMQAEARQAAKQGDMPQAESLLRQAQSLRPTHPGLLLELARALTANDKAEEAAQTLLLAAQMGLVFRLSDNPAFAPLTMQPAYIEAVKQLQQNQQPVGKARMVSSHLATGLIPEGIAYDAARNKTYVSSVAEGTIYDIAQATPFSIDTNYGAFGLKIDAKRDALWLAGAQLAEHNPSRKANTIGGAAITRLHRRTGHIAAQYKLAEDGNQHLLGDIALAADGSVYATDSKAP
ncbi:MAG: tetratricopeptide repeat protein, partial [Betaproteobacteria bacterium]|nr:tetratricopeptide repeat protein [Betaproteobacteria bacterium]